MCTFQSCQLSAGGRKPAQACRAQVQPPPALCPEAGHSREPWRGVHRESDMALPHHRHWPKPLQAKGLGKSFPAVTPPWGARLAGNRPSQGTQQSQRPPKREAMKGSNQISPTEYRGNSSDTQQGWAHPLPPLPRSARANHHFFVGLSPSACRQHGIPRVLRGETHDQMGLYSRVVTYFFL